MIITGDDNKVVGVSATSKNGVHRLTLTLEYNDPSEMGWDLRRLDEDRLAAKEASRPKQRRSKQLALPAPGDV